MLTIHLEAVELYSDCLLLLPASVQLQPRLAHLCKTIKGRDPDLRKYFKDPIRDFKMNANQIHGFIYSNTFKFCTKT